MATPEPPFKVKTTVSWAGEEEGDLGFLENEIVEVYSVVDESWWSGKLRRNGAEGIFPRDYVRLYEDPYGASNINSSFTSNGNSNTPSGPSTPVKEKIIGNGLSKLPGMFHRSPGNGQTMTDHYHQSEILHLQQRELEIERFKKLKQQQQYQIKKIQEQKQKRMSMQLKTSEPSSPMITSRGPGSPSKMKHSHSAQNFKHSEYNTHGQLPYTRGTLPEGKVMHSNIDLSMQPKFQPHLSHRHTAEVLAPEPSSPAGRYSAYDEIEVDEITMKRKQLEKELHQLRLIEKNRKLQYGLSRIAKGISPSDESSSGYVSEDMLSSKKNYREDLGSKLSKDEYHEDDVEELDYIEEHERSVSPPPPPPKHATPLKAIPGGGVIHPYDADDFKFSDEELLRLSQMQLEELKNSIKSLQSDVLNLSELSATSAGSFMRHKHEKEIQSLLEQLLGRVQIQDNEANNKELIDSIFQDKKSRHPNIFKKLLHQKKKSNTSEDLKLLSLNKEDPLENDEIHWTTFKSDMNRMNSLTTQSKQARTKRIVRKEGSLIVKPLEFVSEINSNEVVGEADEEEWESLQRQVSHRRVDSFVAKYDISCDLNEFIADVAVKLGNSKVYQIRAVLLQLCKLHIIEEDPSLKILQVKPKLHEISSKGEASIYQVNYLFKKMLDALRIPSEIVMGFWKRPNEFYHNEQYVINHCWLSILLDDHFFIMDLLSFKNGDICNIRDHKLGFNEHYFLARPLNMVSTHIPSIIDLQHVVPPIDQNIAFYLPRMYLGFYRNQLKFRNFNNALTRLTDLEFFELELEIPCDVELFALIKTAQLTTNELSLCQVYWSNGKRIAKIKAILPENESIGVLQLFSGPKGLQKHFENIHELSVVIPLYHSGSYKPCKFVPRFPTVQSQTNDLYIKQPQTSKVIARNSYNFEIMQHPSQGLNSGSGIINQDFKLVIESPSGKYFKLQATEPGKPFSTYECNIKLTETGHYRGLVIGDSGNSWYVFAQWDCVAGVISN